MRILLFNQQTRNAKALVRALFANSSVQFDKAIFCTNITFKERKYKDGMSLLLYVLTRPPEYKYIARGRYVAESPTRTSAGLGGND